MVTRVKDYDVADHLRSPAEMAAYLEACFAECDGDASFIAKALGDIARARGMSEIARDTGLGRDRTCRRSGGRRDGYNGDAIS